MIGKLKGTLDEIGEDHCIVDVHGVGYIAHCSARTLAHELQQWLQGHPDQAQRAAAHRPGEDAER